MYSLSWIRLAMCLTVCVAQQFSLVCFCFFVSRLLQKCLVLFQEINVLCWALLFTGLARWSNLSDELYTATARDLSMQTPVSADLPSGLKQVTCPLCASAFCR